MRRIPILGPACAGAVLICAASVASACPNPNNASANFTYSGGQLAAGQAFSTQATGQRDISGCGLPEAWGYAADTATMSMTLTQMQGRALQVDVSSQCDSTLLLRAADGSWHFDDDSGGNLMPRLRLNSAAETGGRVDVWIGTYSGDTCPATVTFTAETAAVSPPPQTGTACPNPNLVGTSATFFAGQLAMGQSLSGTAMGTTRLGDCGIPDAWGYATAAPSYSLFLSQMTGHDLSLRVESSCDSTMLVRTPDGQWHFNDDSGGSLNPALRLAAPTPLDGRVDVWLGTYSQGQCPATLSVQSAPEITPPPGRGLITVITATYGANCGAPIGNATDHIAAQCNGLASCDYRVDYSLIGDPAVGCSKTYEVSYACSDGSTWGASAPAEAGFGSIVSLQCSATPTGAMQDLFGTWNINANGYLGTAEFLPIGGGTWTGTLNLGRDEPITDIRFDPQSGRLSFERPQVNQVYTGQVTGDSITGTFTYAGQTYTWSATLSARG